MGILLHSTCVVHAQAVAPSQIVPQSITPQRAPARSEPLQPQTSDAKSVFPDADLTFQAGDVLIDGAFPEMSAANTAFADRLGFKRLSVAQLFAASRELEQAYAQHGFILARVVVPQQVLKEGGTVRVEVIDGFIEEIDVSHLPASIQRAVKARLQPLMGREHLTEAQIERPVLLAGELGGLRLRSALARGRERSGVRLVLAGTLKQLDASVGVDNRLPASLGRWQWNGNLALNNLLHQGDETYFTVGSGFSEVAHTAEAPLSMLGAGIILPLGEDGLTLGSEFLNSRTSTHAAGAPVADGEFSRGQFSVHEPLLLTRQESLRLNATAEVITQSLSVPQFATLLSRDHYYALRLGLTWQRGISDTTESLDVTVSQGLAGREASAQLPLSRLGASPTFSHVGGTARASMPLGLGVGLDVTVRGQSSFGKPQLLSEQFALDAENAVSAFPSGTFNVDSGATVRAELGVAPLAFKGMLAAPYAYTAGGEGWLAHATAVEQASIKAASAGVGARASLAALPAMHTAGATLRVEVGRQFSDVPGYTGDYRANLSAAFSF